MNNHSIRQLFGCFGTAAILLLVSAGITLAQTTAFTYQGKLVDNGAPASGSYDLTFKLFDTATVGSGVQQGATLSLTNVAVSGGVFTVQLDFGTCASCFNGAARFLEISVKPTSGSIFTTLSPRQAVTANPYALKSLSAASADGLSLSCVSCVIGSQIQSVNGSSVNGAIPVASVPAGSTNYIQNTTSQQANTNFNISGNGIVGGNLGIGTMSPQHKLHVIGQAIRVESPDGNIAPRFSLNFTGGGTDQKKWQNYAAGDTLAFTALNDAENAEIAWLRVIRGPGTNINTVSAPNGNVNIGTLFSDVYSVFRLRVEDPGSAGLRVGTSTPGGTVASFGPFGMFDIDAPSIPGGRFRIFQDGQILINSGAVIIKPNGDVGIGTVAPNAKLQVSGDVIINGTIVFTPASGGGTSLCRNSAFQISLCSSSRRYKTNIADFSSGLSLLNHLRPVTFDWKESKLHDLGLVAEEVAEVEPLLVTHNDKGEIEGVKYDRLGVVLINAIKEQQAQIDSLKEQQTRMEALQKENLFLKARLAALERLVSQTHNHPLESAKQENEGKKKEP